MFDELEKYHHKDHFFYRKEDTLSEVCNAPTDKSGVYIVYALKNGRIELVYIGSSGQKERNGQIAVKKTGLGGLKSTIINGKQVGVARYYFWKTKVTKEKIEALDVYWYATHDEQIADCPLSLEAMLLRKHLAIYGRRPRWNDEY